MWDRRKKTQEGRNEAAQEQPGVDSPSPEIIVIDDDDKGNQPTVSARKSTGFDRPKLPSPEREREHSNRDQGRGAVPRRKKELSAEEREPTSRRMGSGTVGTSRQQNSQDNLPGVLDPQQYRRSIEIPSTANAEDPQSIIILSGSEKGDSDEEEDRTILETIDFCETFRRYHREQERESSRLGRATVTTSTADPQPNVEETQQSGEQAGDEKDSSIVPSQSPVLFPVMSSPKEKKDRHKQFLKDLRKDIRAAKRTVAAANGEDIQIETSESDDEDEDPDPTPSHLYRTFENYHKLYEGVFQGLCPHFEMLSPIKKPPEVIQQLEKMQEIQCTKKTSCSYLGLGTTIEIEEKRAKEAWKAKLLRDFAAKRPPPRPSRRSLERATLTVSTANPQLGMKETQQSGGKAGDEEDCNIVPSHSRELNPPILSLKEKKEREARLAKILRDFVSKPPPQRPSRGSLGKSTLTSRRDGKDEEDPIILETIDLCETFRRYHREQERQSSRLGKATVTASTGQPQTSVKATQQSGRKIRDGDEEQDLTTIDLCETFRRHHKEYERKSSSLGKATITANTGRRGLRSGFSSPIEKSPQIIQLLEESQEIRGTSSRYLGNATTTASTANPQPNVEETQQSGGKAADEEDSNIVPTHSPVLCPVMSTPRKKTEQEKQFLKHLRAEVNAVRRRVAAHANVFFPDISESEDEDEDPTLSHLYKIFENYHKIDEGEILGLCPNYEMLSPIKKPHEVIQHLERLQETQCSQSTSCRYLGIGTTTARTGNTQTSVKARQKSGRNIRDGDEEKDLTTIDLCETFRRHHTEYERESSRLGKATVTASTGQPQTRVKATQQSGRKIRDGDEEGDLTTIDLCETFRRHHKECERESSRLGRATVTANTGRSGLRSGFSSRIERPPQVVQPLQESQEIHTTRRTSSRSCGKATTTASTANPQPGVKETQQSGEKAGDEKDGNIVPSHSQELNPPILSLKEKKEKEAQLAKLPRDVSKSPTQGPSSRSLEKATSTSTPRKGSQAPSGSGGVKRRIIHVIDSEEEDSD